MHPSQHSKDMSSKEKKQMRRGRRLKQPEEVVHAVCRTGQRSREGKREEIMVS